MNLSTSLTVSGSLLCPILNESSIVSMSMSKSLSASVLLFVSMCVSFCVHVSQSRCVPVLVLESLSVSRCL